MNLNNIDIDQDEDLCCEMMRGLMRANCNILSYSYDKVDLRIIFNSLDHLAMSETFKTAINQDAFVDNSEIENNTLIIYNLSLDSYIYLGTTKNYTKWMKSYLFPGLTNIPSNI